VNLLSNSTANQEQHGHHQTRCEFAKFAPPLISIPDRCPRRLKAGSSKPNQSPVTWYACGEALPAGKFGAEFERMTLEHINHNMPNLVPTTYDASHAYLDEEQKKPEGKRDLLREMCMMLPLGLPEDRKVYFVSFAMKSIFPLYNGKRLCSTPEKIIHSPSGSIMVFPTTDLAPDSFGTPGNIGFLDSKKLVYEPPTRTSQKGTILLAYFTKTGPHTLSLEERAKAITLDTVPYA
jgi:hypothetical protein